jgi:hypothetical protein
MSDYRIRKISFDDRDIIRKRGLKVVTAASYYHEEFSCGGSVKELSYDLKSIQKRNWGISKEEYRVSKGWRVNIENDVCGL